jgi:hypothetical protein
VSNTYWVCISITTVLLNQFLSIYNKNLIASSQQSRQPNYTTGLDLCVRIYTAYRIAFEMVGLFPLVTSLYPTTFPQVELSGVYNPAWTAGRNTGSCRRWLTQGSSIIRNVV